MQSLLPLTRSPARNPILLRRWRAQQRRARRTGINVLLFFSAAAALTAGAVRQ